VQERGGANDGKEWSYIDEGRWKEQGRGREKGGRQTKKGINRGGCLF